MSLRWSNYLGYVLRLGRAVLFGVKVRSPASQRGGTTVKLEWVDRHTFSNTPNRVAPLVWRRAIEKAHAQEIIIAGYHLQYSFVRNIHYTAYKSARYMCRLHR